MATGLTAMSFVLERKQGLLGRSFVAGQSCLSDHVGQRSVLLVSPLESMMHIK